MLFLALLSFGIHVVGYVHLSTDTVDNCFAVRFPTCDPLDQALELLVVVPVAFKVVVVDEELEVGGVASEFLEVLTGKLNGDANEVVAQVVAPEELLIGIAGVVSRLKVVTLIQRSNSLVRTSAFSSGVKGIELPLTSSV